MKRVGFWLITLAAILGACLTINRDMTPPEYAVLAAPVDLNAPATVAAGRELFLANCAPCHGVLGDGNGEVRPHFGPPPADFTDRTRMQSRTPQYLFWRVSEGGRVEPFRTRGSIMPAWRYHLTEEQRWQVVAYLRTLAR